jgi:dihydropteroate synthase
MINSLSASIPLSINIKGKLITFNKPMVMGVLNITKDSFYEKSRIHSTEGAIETTAKMIEAGALIIDVGAASSRPGAKLVQTTEEIETLLPVLQSLVKQFPEVAFSVDTYNSKTALAALAAGAAIINDISAGTIDKEMFETIASINAPYIMMHMQGLPEFMQNAPYYKNVVHDTLDFFVERVGKARESGIKDIILDPGFGFGKTLEHNYFLLNQLPLFKVFHLPILCGLSRKSLINKVIYTKAEDALNGTTVLNTIALLNGANILRVHDVKEAQQAVDLVHYYNNLQEE